MKRLRIVVFIFSMIGGGFALSLSTFHLMKSQDFVEIMLTAIFLLACSIGSKVLFEK
jgi:hypothetical protein